MENRLNNELNFLGYVLVLIYFCLYCGFTKTQEMEESEAAEDLLVDESDDNTTQVEDQIEEDWINEAVRDVAYYLRSHKFNDFDRRYQTEDTADKYFHRAFPNPPLMNLHWEVYKYCNQGFKECLGYLQETVLRADIYRSIDTATVIVTRGWQQPRNLKSIQNVNAECLRLYAKDWAHPQPFKGPLERFQWRTSASYYMCWYTMQEVPSLALFGERCDNYASCVDPSQHYMSKNYDLRADDRQPFQCALYSFCPDPCCPKRQLNSYQMCLESDDNPCVRNNLKNRHECSYQRKNNKHFEGIAMNHWNVSCQCEPGFVWESRFEMCVDIDECALGIDSCNRTLETCINVKGDYLCSCNWGFEWIDQTCQPSTSLLQSISAYNQRKQPESMNKSSYFSIFQYLYNYSTALFGSAKPK